MMTIKIRPVLVALLLAGCTKPGTRLVFDGTVCDQKVNLELQDAKDRSTFGARVVCGPNGSVEITSAESMTSTVLAEQAKVIGQQTEFASKLLEAATKGAASGVTPGSFRTIDQIMAHCERSDWRALGCGSWE